MDSRGCQQVEAVCPKPSEDNSRCLREELVEALPRNPESSRSCFTGSASTVDSQLCWHGPEWLREEESKWPDSTQEKQDPSIQEIIEAESRGAVVNITAAIAIPTEPIDWDLDYISTWNRLLRRTA
ncbi:hypothetical protein DAPPUDRAFT_248746 [Daphnia pulex]|uniref:Uncharacterized protein n=1 Tax=Daphnia pulex TaxID=6669 RepID=E9GV48_DAPPU|nr:hypothetical protein DAPPUDRAFT_248746 [Daphnia pulex]|eukprot:EFX76674.1 hypothetical protein DAPPUDRAFT_248746 [Daphnia pulex]